MKIIIVGAGEVGSYLCGLLSGKAHDVTVIESDEAIAQRVDELIDAKVLTGNGSSAETLVKAGVRECHFFLAMTSEDRTNLVATSLAKVLGAQATITRVHDQTYTDNSYVNYQLHFGIDHMINPEGLCAVQLAKSIRNPGRVAVEYFSRGQIEAQQVTVTRRSRFIGKKLRDIPLEQVRIGFIQRRKEVEVPSAETVLEEDNRVTIFGHPDVLLKMKTKFDPESKEEPVRVALYGGGETAVALARLLANPRYKIRIIEKDGAICRELADKFPRVTVINGDATSLRLLEEEQIGSADYFVASTKDDEDNIMTGLQASKLGAAHVQLVINKTDYEDVLDGLKSSLGVEMMVSPRVTTAREVLRYLSTEPMLELATLPDGVGKVLEIHLSHNNRFAGQPLRQIPLPRGCVIVALLHKFQAKVPGADDIILGGDRIVLISQEGNTKELQNLVSAD